MRRACRVALLALACAVASRGVAAQTVSARLGGELTGFPFSVVMVPVAVDMSASGGEKLGSYTARLVWNPASLSPCLDQYCGYNMVGNFPLPQLNGDSIPYGVLKFTAISPVGAGGLITLAQFPFTIVDTVGTPLTLSFSEMSAAGTFTNLLPQLAVSNGVICPARGRWGDVDRDTHANSRDALITLSTVVGLPIDTTFDASLADVNADGRVQSVDALIILSYAVGIDIPGQRVLLLAPTSCGTGSARTLAVFPPSAELVPNQTLPLLLQARDTAGRLVTVSDAVWRSSDYTLATVDGAGVVTPRAAGTVTITGEVGPGVRASATITVIPRRTVWEADARVTGAALQLGSAAYPFDHPARAFPFVAEGDTIHAASGTYDFEADGQLSVGVVIRGGAVGDTTTRPVFRDVQQGYHTGLQLQGGVRTLVQNVVFRNFAYAVDMDGVRSFALEDSRIESRPGTYGTGIYACGSGTIDTVRVDRSVLVGDSSGSGLDNDYCVERTALVLIRDSRISGWGDGVVWTDGDSMVVLRTTIADNDGYGINAGQEYDVSPSLYVAHSRIERNYYEGIYGYPMRRVVIDTSVIVAVEDDGIDVEGGCGECSDRPMQLFAMHGDTIYMTADDYSWLSLYDADSMIIDRSVVRFPDTASIYASGYASSVTVGRITNSDFLSVGAGTLLDFNGDDLLVDNVRVTGCAAASCDQASGFSGSAHDARFRNSTFSQLYYALQVGSSGSGGIHEATNLTMDSVSYAMQLGGDSAYVANNRLTRVSYLGIEAGTGGGSPGGVVLQGNSVACTAFAGSQYGLLLDTPRRYTVFGDTVTGCGTAVYLRALLSGSIVRGTALRNGQYGVRGDQYTYDTVTVAVDSNGISGMSQAAAYYTGGHVLFTRNRIENNGQFGLQTSTALGQLNEAHFNAFANNPFGAIYAAGDSVNAQSNYWGSAAGACQGGDCVVGPVDTSSFLTAPPLGLPGLSPPLLAALATTISPTSTTGVAPRQPARVSLHIVKAARASRHLPAGVSPERAAQIQRAATKRAARAAQRASRQAARRGPS
ncbi:MAG: right-handed parallel beta-helix repeat-containing protein [Gemmatimonadales bacterium]